MSDSRRSGPRLLALVLLLGAVIGVLGFPRILLPILSGEGFMPHGHCYLWRPGLVVLHVTSDVFIWLSYMTISLTIVYIVRQRICAVLSKLYDPNELLRSLGLAVATAQLRTLHEPAGRKAPV